MNEQELDLYQTEFITLLAECLNGAKISGHGPFNAEALITLHREQLKGAYTLGTYHQTNIPEALPN